MSRIAGAGSAINRHRAIAAAIAVALAAGSIWAAVKSGSSSAASLIVAPVSYSTIKQEISLAGNIEPETEVGLTFGLAGIVSSVNVTAGQTVKAGTVLASLDTTTVKAQLALAQDALVADKAALAQAQASLALTGRLNSDGLSQAQLTAAQDQTRLSADQATLAQDQAIAISWCKADASSSECVQAQQSLSTDQSNVQADEQNLASAQLNVTATQDKNTQSIDSASAVVAQDQTALTIAQNQLAENLATETTDQNTLCTSSSTTPCTSQATLDQQEQAVAASQQTVNADITSLSNAQTSLSDAQSSATTALAQSQLVVTNASQKLTSDQTALTLAAQIASGGCTADPSSTECNSAQSAITAASQSVSSDQTQLATAQSALPFTQAKNSQSIQQLQDQIATTQDQIAMQETIVANDQTAIADSEIVAPISGTVNQVNIAAGHSASLSSAATPSGAIILSSPGGYQVQASVSDALISQVKLGEQAIIVPAGATSTVYGTVTQITPQATITAGVATFPITVSITNSDPSSTSRAKVPELFAGASAQVALVVRQATHVLSVPTSAVHTIGSRNFVFVSSRASSRSPEKKVDIVIGAADSLHTQVVSGLTLGQSVVIVNARVAVPIQTGGLGFGGFAGGLGGRGAGGKAGGKAGGRGKG